MGFVDFLLGGLKILVVGAITLFAGIGASLFLSYGETLVGGILGVIAFVGGMYVVYERGQQRKRI